MDCQQSRDLISSRLDGRCTTTEERLLDAHLGGCPDCHEFERRAWSLHRTLRLRPATSVPDLTDRILLRARHPRRTRLTWLRWSLGWVGVLGVAQAVPDLVLGGGDGPTQHLARHVGALNLALFVGFLFAAWRPHRAFGLLPVATVLAAAMVVGATVDIASGNVHATSELAAHVVDLAGVVLLWMLSGQPRPSTQRLRLRPQV